MHKKVLLSVEKTILNKEVEKTNCLHYNLQIRIVTCKLENCVSAQVFFCVFKIIEDEGVKGRGINVLSAC